MNLRSVANVCMLLGMSLLHPAQADDSAQERQVELPVKALRWGGFSGEACLALPLSQTQAVGPAHCVVSSDGILSISRPRDYAQFKNPSPFFLRDSMKAIHDQPAGGFVVVDLGGKQSRAKVASSAGSSYELSGRFCPGDSGAPIWGVQDGKLRWLGMLISGEGAGCSQRGIAIKSQAIHLDGFE